MAAKATSREIERIRYHDYGLLQSVGMGGSSEYSRWSMIVRAFFETHANAEYLRDA